MLGTMRPRRNRARRRFSTGIRRTGSGACSLRCSTSRCPRTTPSAPICCCAITSRCGTCWKSCDIRGASDASIANPHPNDLSRVLEKAPVRRVFCTGAAAGRYYAKLCEAASGLAAEVLPSPSPAKRGSGPPPRLVEAYRPVADATTPLSLPCLSVVPGGGARAGHRGGGHAARRAHAPRRPHSLLSRQCEALEGMEGAKECGTSFAGKTATTGGDGWVAKGRYPEPAGASPVCLVTAVEPAALTAEPARAAALRATVSLSAHSQVVLAPSGRGRCRACLTAPRSPSMPFWALGSPTRR